MKFTKDSLKILFNKFSLREKFLLASLFWVVIFIWINSLVNQFSGVLAELDNANKELAYQQVWIDNQESIEAQLANALNRINPEKTYNAARLVGKIDSFARSLNLNHELSTPKTQIAEIFKLNTLTVSMRGQTISKLIDFNKKVQAEFPQIVLRELSLNANNSNPNLLDARFTIDSFELNN